MFYGLITASDLLRKEKADAMLELHAEAWETIEQTQHSIAESMSSLDKIIRSKRINRAELEAIRQQLAQISKGLDAFVVEVPKKEIEQTMRLEGLI